MRAIGACYQSFVLWSIQIGEIPDLLLVKGNGRSLLIGQKLFLLSSGTLTLRGKVILGGETLLRYRNASTHTDFNRHQTRAGVSDGCHAAISCRGNPGTAGPGGSSSVVSFS